MIKITQNCHLKESKEGRKMMANHQYWLILSCVARPQLGYMWVYEVTSFPNQTSEVRLTMTGVSCRQPGIPRQGLSPMNCWVKMLQIPWHLNALLNASNFCLSGCLGVTPSWVTLPYNREGRAKLQTAYYLGNNSKWLGSSIIRTMFQVYHSFSFINWLL